MKITFDNLPQAVQDLNSKLDAIERLLLNVSPETHKEDLMSIKEAAKLLDLAVPTLYSKVSRREIPCSKRAGRLYFSRKEITIWIEGGNVSTEKEANRSPHSYLKGAK